MFLAVGGKQRSSRYGGFGYQIRRLGKELDALVFNRREMEEIWTTWVLFVYYVYKQKSIVITFRPKLLYPNTITLNLVTKS